jgi:hypothetical protein
MKMYFKEAWTSISFGWIVTRNAEGDTRVMGSMARGGFFAYQGDNGKVLVGHADMAKLDGGKFNGPLSSVRRVRKMRW